MKIVVLKFLLLQRVLLRRSFLLPREHPPRFLPRPSGAPCVGIVRREGYCLSERERESIKFQELPHTQSLSLSIQKPLASSSSRSPLPSPRLQTLEKKRASSFSSSFLPSRSRFCGAFLERRHAPEKDDLRMLERICIRVTLLSREVRRKGPPPKKKGKKERQDVKKKDGVILGLQKP